MADQVSCASTATPLEIATTLTTPGTALVLEASKLATFPPNTGQRWTTAYSIPGKRTSMPNLALPSTLMGVSKRLGDVPIKRNCLGSFNTTEDGGLNCAAASAKLP